MRGFASKRKLFVENQTKTDIAEGVAASECASVVKRRKETKQAARPDSMQVENRDQNRRGEWTGEERRGRLLAGARGPPGVADGREGQAGPLTAGQVPGTRQGL